MYVDFTLAVHICIIIRDEMIIRSPIMLEATKIHSPQYSINLNFLPTSLLWTTFSLGLSPAFSFAFSACISMPASKKPSAKNLC
jgi:hypothetical protein